MRKIFMLLMIAAFILQSCQKDTSDKLPEEDTVSSDNPAQLSAAIKVWHGKRTQGNMPLPNSSVPEIDPTANPEIHAFAGRYAIIKPEVLNGTVAGYYVGIPGADHYFKVDFSSPRDIAGRLGPRQAKRSARPGITGRLFDIQDGTADSSIVIVLPPTIQVPDTFCVTYYPFDADGNIGTGVNTCIIVGALGTDANNAWLQNEWKFTCIWVENSPLANFIDTIIYNKWVAAQDYKCLVAGNSLVPTIDGDPETVINDSIFYWQYNMRFGTNGAMDFHYKTDYKEIDEPNSTCSDFQYLPVEGDSTITTGGWSYDPVTKRLLTITEFDNNGVPEPALSIYNVIRINNNHCILAAFDNTVGEVHFRMER